MCVSVRARARARIFCENDVFYILDEVGVQYAYSCSVFCFYVFDPKPSVSKQVTDSINSVVASDGKSFS